MKNKNLVCNNCGMNLAPGTDICPNCGMQMKAMKKQKDGKLKTIIIIVVVLLVIGVIASKGGNKKDNSGDKGKSYFANDDKNNTPTEKTEEKPTEAPTEAPTESVKPDDSTDKDSILAMFENGDFSLVTPEFKESMDAYAAFYDEYLEFMKSYMSNPLGMMDQYTEFLEKIDKFDKEMEDVDETKLSLADDLYYLKVTLDVEKKLLGSLSGDDDNNKTNPDAGDNSAEKETVQAAFDKGDFSLVTPDFKKAVDDYEAFFDSYIEFMKKYEADPMTYMNDYLEWMNKYNDYLQSITTLSTKMTTIPDILYFELVNARVDAKLALLD